MDKFQWVQVLQGRKSLAKENNRLLLCENPFLILVTEEIALLRVLHDHIDLRILFQYLP